MNWIVVTRGPFRMLIERLYGSRCVNLIQQKDKKYQILSEGGVHASAMPGVTLSDGAQRNVL